MKTIDQIDVNQLKNDDTNCFITVCEGAKQKDGALSGIAYAAKDNILTKDVKTTAASQSLCDFVPYYEAKVIELLNDAGAVLVAKTNMDELALGSSGETSYFGKTLNPVFPGKTPGGSSSGSAVAVAKDYVGFALGSDTSGSIRQPAAFCKVVGIKPTYGSVSNSGLVSCATSMDTIGTLTKTVEDGALVLSVITQRDINCNEDTANKTVGIIKQSMDYKGLDSAVKNSFNEAIEKLKAKGIKVVEIDMPNFENQLTVYNIISTAELSSNMAKFDGIKFGYRAKGDSWEEIFVNSRTEGFGTLVKERIIKGTYYLAQEGYDSCLIPAQKVRTLIINEYEEAMKNCDLILSPTTPTLPFNEGESKGDEDVFTVGASLVGMPAMSVPYNDMGIEVIASYDNETTMLSLAKLIEEL